MSNLNIKYLQWTLGDRLRKVRRAHGWSTRDFADRLGVTSSTLAQWETDRSLPRNCALLAEQIEDLTGVDAEWIIEGCCVNSITGMSHAERLAQAQKAIRDQERLDVSGDDFDQAS